MRTIKEWQQIIAQAANHRFPNNAKWSQQDRILSIQRQLADVGGAIQKEQGLLESDNHAHQDPDHRIAALIADILILAEMRGADVEVEMQKVLDWFTTLAPRDEGLVVQLLGEAKELTVLVEDGFPSKQSHYLLESLFLVLRQMGYFFTQQSAPLSHYGSELSQAEKDVLGKIKDVRDAIGHRESEKNFLNANLKLVGNMNFKDGDVEIQYGGTKLYLLREVLAVHKKLRQLFSSATELAFLQRGYGWGVDERELQEAEIRLAEKLKDPKSLLGLNRENHQNE